MYENIQNGPLKLPNFLSDEAKNLLISLLNRNPYKRLGAGKRGAEEIKEHPFLKSIDWDQALQRKLKVPKPYMKKVAMEDIPLEQVYGKGAFDESLQHLNKINDWTFVEPQA